MDVLDTYICETCDREVDELCSWCWDCEDCCTCDEEDDEE
jgi:hypothetical protein